MQYRTFLEYNENRQGEKFEQKFYSLCEAIAHSGVSFESYWENAILPTILEKSPYMESEEELLDNLLVEWNPFKGLFGGGKQSAVDRNKPGRGPTPQWIQDHENERQAQQQAAADKESRFMNKHQGRADAAVKNVSTKFMTSLRDVLKTLTDEAKTNNDRFTWQIAKMFHDKLANSVQKFSVNVARGKDPMAQQFGNDRAAMQQGQAQAAANSKMGMGGAEDAQKAQQVVQQIMKSNAGMGASALYDPKGGFTQAAVDQFRIPKEWIGKTIKQIYKGVGTPGQSNAATTSGAAPQGTNPAGPPTQQGNPTLDAAKKKFPSGAYMQAAHNSHEGEGDVMIESLVEVYTYKPKFGLF